MEQNDCRTNLIAAATPLFAAKGLNGVSVRELAKAGGSNLSMITYYFGGKAGLYEAVLKEVFSDLLLLATMAETDLATSEKFTAYLYQCGICFHSGAGEEFIPHTASADPASPECPRCLNNDAESFTEESKGAGCAAALSVRRANRRP
jgi:AcrR family transcriptional regulator